MTKSASLYFQNISKDSTFLHIATVYSKNIEKTHNYNNNKLRIDKQTQITDLLIQQLNLTQKTINKWRKT